MLSICYAQTPPSRARSCLSPVDAWRGLVASASARGAMAAGGWPCSPSIAFDSRKFGARVDGIPSGSAGNNGRVRPAGGPRCQPARKRAALCIFDLDVTGWRSVFCCWRLRRSRGADGLCHKIRHAVGPRHRSSRQYCYSKQWSDDRAAATAHGTLAGGARRFAALS